MHVVEGISDRVVALDHGVKIAEGSFERSPPIRAWSRRTSARRRRRRSERSERQRERWAPEPLLRLDGVDTYYGQIHILQGLSLEVRPGELVCLLGGNASGKSTTLKTILGLVQPRNGSIYLEGEDVTSRPTNYRIRKGIAIVPENRRLFGPMTVLENLEMGAYLRGRRREGGLRPRLRRSSRSCTSGARSSRERCRAASSRWWPWDAR